MRAMQGMPRRPHDSPPNFAHDDGLLLASSVGLFCVGLSLREVDTHGEHRMSPTRYFLVQHDDDWMIKFADEDFGPYKSKSEAMLFAVDAARKLGERGNATEVCLMGENGFFHAEWSNRSSQAALA